MKPLRNKQLVTIGSINDKTYHLRMWKAMVYENLFEYTMQRIDDTIDTLTKYRTDLIDTYIEIYGKMPSANEE